MSAASKAARWIFGGLIGVLPCTGADSVKEPWAVAETRLAFSSMLGGKCPECFSFEIEIRNGAQHVRVTLSQSRSVSAIIERDAYLKHLLRERLKDVWKNPLYVRIARPGEVIADNRFRYTMNKLPFGNPAVTYFDRDSAVVTIIAPTLGWGKMGDLSRILSRPDPEFEPDAGSGLAHELGHVQSALNQYQDSTAKEFAIEVENIVRRHSAPNAPSRLQHDVPHDTPTKVDLGRHLDDPISIHHDVAKEPSTGTESALRLAARTEVDANAELEAIKSALKNANAAEMLKLERVYDHVEVRYAVSVDSISEFSQQGSLESLLGEIIQSKVPIEFGLASVSRIFDTEVPVRMRFFTFISIQEYQVGKAFGGGVTHSSDVTLSRYVEVRVDPDRLLDRQACAEGIPKADVGEVVAHELLGHAVALSRGLPRSASDELAVQAENEARSRGGESRMKKQRHHIVKNVFFPPSC